MTCRNCQGSEPCSCTQVGKHSFTPYQNYDLPPAISPKPTIFPHKCPLCTWTAADDGSPMYDAVKRPICTACKGEGIVWG